MKFRNYVPHDKELQEGKLAPPVLPKFEDPVTTEPPQLKEVVLSVLLLYVLKQAYARILLDLFLLIVFHRENYRTHL